MIWLYEVTGVQGLTYTEEDAAGTYLLKCLGITYVYILSFRAVFDFVYV